MPDRICPLLYFKGMYILRGQIWQMLGVHVAFEGLSLVTRHVDVAMQGILSTFFWKFQILPQQPKRLDLFQVGEVGTCAYEIDTEKFPSLHWGFDPIQILAYIVPWKWKFFPWKLYRLISSPKTFPNLEELRRFLLMGSHMIFLMVAPLTTFSQSLMSPDYNFCIKKLP